MIKSIGETTTIRNIGTVNISDNRIARLEEWRHPDAGVVFRLMVAREKNTYPTPTVLTRDDLTEMGLLFEKGIQDAS